MGSKKIELSSLASPILNLTIFTKNTTFLIIKIRKG
jgi:hypothetical protein